MSMEQMKKDRPVPGARLRRMIWIVAALALLAPLIAMQFTAEVNWTPADFLVFGAMLLMVCGAYELGCRLTARRAYRLLLGIALLAGFLLVWASLALPGTH